MANSGSPGYGPSMSSPLRISGRVIAAGRALAGPLPIRLAERIWELSRIGLTELEADCLGLSLAILLDKAAHPAFERKPLKSGLGKEELSVVTDYMRAQLAGDLSLFLLASLVSLSPYQFARVFKASTGVPPHHYVMELRVERAKEMLIAGFLSVTEIAHACGFASSQHMATVFRRMTGITPTEFRRRSRI